MFKIRSGKALITAVVVEDLKESNASILNYKLFMTRFTYKSITSYYFLAPQYDEGGVCNELVNYEGEKPDAIQRIFITQVANEPGTADTNK